MKPCSILVIDDEHALREILSQVLTDAGHRVVGAENGKEASKALAKAAFDVVLTDVIMPEKDGMQVISEVRKSFRKFASSRCPEAGTCLAINI